MYVLEVDVDVRSAPGSKVRDALRLPAISLLGGKGTTAAMCGLGNHCQCVYNSLRNVVAECRGARVAVERG